MMKRPGQGRVHAVLYLFHVAQHEGELIEYLTELTQGPAKEYFRPKFFANTPDILPAFCRRRRPAFRIRLALAGTLSASTASTTATSLRERAIPDREEYSPPRNTSTRSGTGTAPATSSAMSRS